MRRSTGAGFVLGLAVGPALVLLLGAASCADTSPPSLEGGGRVAVQIAPLALSGVDDVCFDLRVSSGAGTVWALGDPSLTRLGADQTEGGLTGGAPDLATLCSSRYGSGAGGDLSYVGTCDAASDVDDDPSDGLENAVTVWVDGLYRGGADLGDWRDPCPNGCTLEVPCRENADSPVRFDLSVMRRAQQGFFDVAVSFEDVFCSAKLDTCYYDSDPPRPIALLSGDDPGRDWTAVFGFACTAGASAGASELFYGPVEVRCGATVFALDPSAGPGNASVSAGGHTLDYALYRDAEDLACGGGVGSCGKVFWNLALSLDDLAALGGDCALTLSATAGDGGPALVDGELAGEHRVYPYLIVDGAPLTASGRAFCQQNGLDDEGVVATEYRGDLGAALEPPAMCQSYDGVTVSATGACAPPAPPSDIPPGMLGFDGGEASWSALLALPNVFTNSRGLTTTFLGTSTLLSLAPASGFPFEEPSRFNFQKLGDVAGLPTATLEARFRLPTIGPSNPVLLMLEVSKTPWEHWKTHVYGATGAVTQMTFNEELARATITDNDFHTLSYAVTGDTGTLSLDGAVIGVVSESHDTGDYVLLSIQNFSATATAAVEIDFLRWTAPTP